MTLIEKADRFRALHFGPDTLVLPNAWDAAGARIFELEGFPALGTTSAGIAFALGYCDGQQVDPDEMFDAIGRIARVVQIPVTADVEAGYGDVAATALAVINAGAVGLNLEDYENGELIELATQVERIQTMRDAAGDFPLVINARTEIYLAEIGDPESRLDRTLERINAFVEAGADCVFVPGVRDEQTIGRLTAAGPLNILATTGTPTIEKLNALGVARVSVGSGPMRATLALTQRIARELRTEGTYASYTTDAMPYPDANQLFNT